MRDASAAAPPPPCLADTAWSLRTGRYVSPGVNPRGWGVAAIRVRLGRLRRGHPPRAALMQLKSLPCLLRPTTTSPGGAAGEAIVPPVEPLQQMASQPPSSVVERPGTFVSTTVDAFLGTVVELIMVELYVE